jgi:hypothetical protein
VNSLPGQYVSIGAADVNKSIADAKAKADEAGKLLVTAWNSTDIQAVAQARNDLNALSKDAVGLITKKIQFPNTELIQGALDPNSPAGQAINMVMTVAGDGKITKAEFNKLADFAASKGGNSDQARLAATLAKTLYDGKISKDNAKALVGSTAAIAGGVCGPAALVCSTGFSIAASAATGPIYDLIAGSHKKARRAANKAENVCLEVRRAYEDTLSKLMASYKANVAPSLPADTKPTLANLSNMVWSSDTAIRQVVLIHMANAGVPSVTTLDDPSTGSCDMPRACKALQSKGCYAPSTIQKKASRLQTNAVTMLKALEVAAPKILKAYADIAAAKNIQAGILKLEAKQKADAAKAKADAAKAAEAKLKAEYAKKAKETANQKLQAEAMIKLSATMQARTQSSAEQLKVEKNKKYAIIGSVVAVTGAAVGYMLYSKTTRR